MYSLGLVIINGITVLYNLKKKNQEPTEKQRDDIVRRFSGGFDKNLYWRTGNILRNKEMFKGIDIIFECESLM